MQDCDNQGLEGSCLCGSVRWRIEGELTPLAHCHCSICRKMHGSAFATYMAVEPAQLRWLDGEGCVVRHQTSPGFQRGFCGRCGSVVPGQAPDGHVFVPAGCLGQDPRLVAKIHIFASSRAVWYAIDDGLRRFDAFPKAPARVADRPRVASERPVRGSCQCDTVAFELTAPITWAHNCHCSRCRKARAAAFASNGFTTLDGIRWLRGSEAVTLYQLPQARFFAQAFCSRCGSPVPRADPGRGIAVIPYGCLDNAPDLPPQANIFVASKADWYVIADRLPQFAAARP